MGDRANLKITTQTGKPAIWLYTHSEGSELPEMLQEALKVSEPRWSDSSYGCRIILDQLTKAHRDQETGAGIDTEPGDNEHNVLEIDLQTERAQVRSQSGFFDNDNWQTEAAIVAGPISFEEYMALENPGAWRNAN